MNFVLIAQVIVGYEKADLDVSPRNKFFRLVRKQQRSCTPEITPLPELQVFQQGVVAVVQDFFAHTLTISRPSSEKLESRLATIRGIKTWYRCIVPMPALFTQQKSVQRCTFQFLLGATAAVVILTL